MEVLPQYCKDLVNFVAILQTDQKHTQKLVQSHFSEVGSEFPLITNLELVRRLNEVGKDSPGFVDIKFPSKEVLPSYQ